VFLPTLISKHCFPLAPVEMRIVRCAFSYPPRDPLVRLVLLVLRSPPLIFNVMTAQKIGLHRGQAGVCLSPYAPLLQSLLPSSPPPVIHPFQSGLIGSRRASPFFRPFPSFCRNIPLAVPSLLSSLPPVRMHFRHGPCSC